MKFENERYKISIEKKELSEEQKEALRLRAKKRRPFVVLALLLVVVLVGGLVWGRYHAGENTVPAQINTVAGEEASDDGNQSDWVAVNDEDSSEDAQEYGQVEGEYVAATKLASGIREKYANESLYGYTYADPIENVGRAEAITFELGYDVTDLGIEKWTEVYALYQDPELTYPMGVQYDFDKETGIFTMKPTDAMVPCQISMLGLDVGTVQKYPHNRHYLFGNGAGNSWGNIGTAYLASYRDKETGELLDKPEVSIVTFQAEIEETPSLTYTITEDGRAQFSWNEVEGADEYFLCGVIKSEKNGYNTSMEVINITEDTTWITDYPEYGTSTANEDFRMFEISEDDWKNEMSYEYNLEKYGEPDVPYARKWLGENYEKGFCVIAVNEDGTSMISNIFDASELASKLPNKVASYTRGENGYINAFFSYETVETLPSYDYITMCDGYTATKRIDYQTEDAYVEDTAFMIVDEETGELIGKENVKCLNIPYRVEGTSFLNVFSIAGVDGDGYNETAMEKDLAFLVDREEKLAPKSGSISFGSPTKYSASKTVDFERIRKVDTDIFANTALTEYLATNMLSGVNTIDLSMFPEATDRAAVDDALMEAYYQNPLILGIEGYRISSTGKKVWILYEESPESQAKKQVAIQKKVSEVVAEVISKDMTDRDKVVALNQYLCDTVEYDDDALENAEKYDFATVDKEYYDSFNAYGALINGKCVCAGYAAAFRLLAQEAGLESIVVTGFLEGSLAHAWNKVKIDEEWYIVDVTNNDDEYFFNALLNLPDKVGNKTLVEDEDYMIDARIPMYTGQSDDNEYYHITDNYFPVQEVAEILASELEKDGSATLRTDYELNDNEFYDITDAVYDIMGDDVDLYGYYWLGVIYLTTEK